MYYLRTLLCLSLLACGTAAALPDAPRVDNPAQPAEPPEVLQLEELWRIGGEDDEDTLLGVVNQVLADDPGNLYLLDIQLLEVQVFSPDGVYERSLGHAGDGPGEFRRASSMLFMPDGTLGIVQQFPGRIVKLNLDGLPAGEIKLGGDDPTAGGFQILRSAVQHDGRLFVSGARMTREENQRTAVNYIAPLDAATGPGHPFLEATTVRDFGKMTISEKAEYFPHQGGWTVGPDGQILVAPLRNTYEINSYSSDGQLERVISRDYQSLDRTDAERTQVTENMIPRRRRNRGDVDVVVERTVRDILELRTDATGRLWVLPSRGIKDQPEGIHSTWDVFDPQGSFQRTVAVACEGRGGQDALFFVGEDRVVLIKAHTEAMQAFRGQGQEQDAEDIEARPLEVVVYRIAK